MDQLKITDHQVANMSLEKDGPIGPPFSFALAMSRSVIAMTNIEEALHGKTV